MNDRTTVLGLDVHKETIAAALLSAGADAPRDWGQVANTPEAVRKLAQRAQDRLTRTFWRLVSRNKPSQVAVVAVARELAGFVWALARQAVPEAKA